MNRANVVACVVGPIVFCGALAGAKWIPKIFGVPKVVPGPVAKAPPPAPDPVTAARPPASFLVTPLLDDMVIVDEPNHAVVEFNPKQARITGEWCDVVVKTASRRLRGRLRLDDREPAMPSQFNHPHNEIFLSPVGGSDPSLNVLHFHRADDEAYATSTYAINICGPDNLMHPGYLITISDDAAAVPIRGK